MEGIKLEINEESLKKMAAESILAQLTEDQRTSIVTQAVQYLLGKDENKGYGYSSRKTRLEEAFERAINGMAHEVAREVLTEMPEVRERIKALVAEAYDRALEQDRETTVRRLADAIVGAMQCHKE